MLELRHFRYFIAVAEELHFGRAAERLSMTQPPLSMQIRKLEEAVGAPLIDRDCRPIELTAAGKALLIHARSVLSQAESAVQIARQTASGDAGHLNIAVTSASVLSLIPRLIGLFRRRFPLVGINLKEMVSRDQSEALRQGTINLGLIRPPIDHSIINIMPIQVEPIVVALPRSHRLADLADISVSAFANEPFISFDPNNATYFYQLADTLFTQYGVRPNIVQSVTQLHTVVALVATGMGLALVPEAASRIQLEDVVLRPLALDTPPLAELCIAWNKTDPNPALESFLGIVREEWVVGGR